MTQDIYTLRCKYKGTIGPLYRQFCIDFKPAFHPPFSPFLLPHPHPYDKMQSCLAHKSHKSNLALPIM